MVKNTIGGKKGKMLSKKHHITNNSSFPVSTDEGMIYVCVVKIFGGGVFEVMDKNKEKYKAYLRGKMKGSNKRHNLVLMNSILLVGIRSDLSDKFSVDILFVYENHHIQTLSLNSQFPTSLLYYLQGNVNGIMANDIGTNEMGGDSFVFSDIPVVKSIDIDIKNRDDNTIPDTATDLDLDLDFI
jgi:translation initiation factor IF-1